MADGKKYDAIVLGVGTMGAAACYQLAKRGYRVLGLEQFETPHEYGSHGGQTRIIRKAYGEESNYVPLLERAYENWETLQRETHAQVYFKTGIVYMGGPNNQFLETVRKSSRDFQISISEYSSNEFSKAFPQFSLPDDFECLEEPEAGFLLPERCIRLLVQQARRHGADIHTNERVLSWEKSPSGIKVATRKGTYMADKLVITAGPWAGKMIPGFESKSEVTRQVIGWMKPQVWDDFTVDNFPCWLVDLDDQVFYGFPILPEGETEGPIGLKLGLHHPMGPVSNPDAVNRNVTTGDERILIDFLHQYIPRGYLETIETKTCLYTNTPDHHFVVDHLPGYGGNVVIAAGFSGHGFKFASAFGEVLADLAMKGSTDLPIGFLSAARFGR